MPKLNSALDKKISYQYAANGHTSVTTTFFDCCPWCAGERRRLCRWLLGDVGRERDAGGLKGGAHLACYVRAGGNDLAVLFDGGLLEAVEIVEQRLPFGLKALVMAQPRQLDTSKNPRF